MYQVYKKYFNLLGVWLLVLQVVFLVVVSSEKLWFLLLPSITFGVVLVLPFVLFSAVYMGLFVLVIVVGTVGLMAAVVGRVCHGILVYVERLSASKN